MAACAGVCVCMRLRAFGPGAAPPRSKGQGIRGTSSATAASRMYVHEVRKKGPARVKLAWLAPRIAPAQRTQGWVRPQGPRHGQRARLKGAALGGQPLRPFAIASGV